MPGHRLIGAVLLTLLVLSGSVTLGTTERRVALVIGNAAYEHVEPLANPGNDADAISAKLSALGFSVTKLVDVPLPETREAIERFGRQSTRADVALVFYAGHGLQVAGQNYLLPVDARLEAAEDIYDASIRVADLQAALVAARPEIAVLILDACRDNPLAEALETQPGLASGSVFAGGFRSGDEATGMLIAFAAAPGAVAGDGVDGNSPFTTALLQWIDRPGLEIGTLFRRVRQTVVDLTDGAQVPWVEEALLSEVYLNRSDPILLAEAEGRSFGTALLSTIRQIQNPTERRAGFALFERLVPGGDYAEAGELRAQAASLDADDEFMQHSLIWLSIRDSDDPAIFQAFLDRFPQSAFVDLARLRLAALGGPPPADAPPAEPQVAPSLLVEAAEPPSTRPLEAPLVSRADSEAQRPVGSSPGSLVPLAPGADAAAAEVEAAAPPSPAEAEEALGLDQDLRIALQRLLAAAGHYQGGLDGALGPMSRRAIEAFQAEVGLPGTGHADQALLRQLAYTAAPRVLSRELEPTARMAVQRLAAYGRFGPGAGPKIVRFRSIDRHPPIQAYWRELADAFEAEHPGVVIDMATQHSSTYRHNLLVMLGSETPPDLFFTWGGGHLRAISEGGFARDLTEEMAEGWAMQFKPGALENLTDGDRIYAAPFHITLVSLWINRPLFEARGIDPARLETWDGFLGVVRELRAAGVTPLAVGGAERWPLQFYWGALAHRIGGREAFDAAIAGEGEGFAGPVFVEAGRKLRELVELDPFPPGWLDATPQDSWDAFAAGETAMILAGSWALPRMTRMWPGGRAHGTQDIARVDFPPRDVGHASQTLTYGMVPAWVVRRDAPDETVEFLRRLTSIEAQTMSASMGYDVPILAAADASIDDPLLGDTAVLLTRTDHHQLVYDMALGPTAGEAVNDIVVALVEGDLTPEQAAEEVRRAWERVRTLRLPEEEEAWLHPALID